MCSKNSLSRAYDEWWEKIVKFTAYVGRIYITSNHNNSFHPTPYYVRWRHGSKKRGKVENLTQAWTYLRREASWIWIAKGGRSIETVWFIKSSHVSCDKALSLKQIFGASSDGWNRKKVKHFLLPFILLFFTFFFLLSSTPSLSCLPCCASCNKNQRQQSSSASDFSLFFSLKIIRRMRTKFTPRLPFFYDNSKSEE